MVDLRTYGINTEEGKTHEAIIYSLVLIYNILNNEMTAFFKPYDLTPGKFNILIAIKHHGGEKGLPQGEIGKHLIVTKSNMSKLLDKLEREGFVSRHALQGDKRVNLTRITKKGEKLLDSLWYEYCNKLEGFVSKLNGGQQKQLSMHLMTWFSTLVD